MDPDSDGWPLADWTWAGSVSFLGGSLAKASLGVRWEVSWRLT